MGKIIRLEETRCSFNVNNVQGCCILHIDAEIIDIAGFGKQAKITTNRPIHGKTEFYKDYDGADMLMSIVIKWLYEETGIHCPDLVSSNLQENEIEISDEEIVTFFPNEIF